MSANLYAMTKHAAIYCRISKDDGTALGVGRQEADCLAWCERQGWTVAEVLTDNDVSAYSGKARPQYRRLTEGIEAGTFDALVVWHPDRLHRSPVELEGFIDLVERHRIAVATVTAGDYDLTTPDGRLTARIIGAVARKESEDKSRRLRRKHLELAEAGKVSGGGRRPFGYEADRVTIRPTEADEIRRAMARVLGGDSLRSIVHDWNARGVATVTGAAWSPTTLKRLLMSPRIAGIRVHNGKPAGPAVWPAIVDADEVAKASAILTTRKATRSARKNLLTGFVWCEACGVRMTSAPIVRKGHRYTRYACTVDRGGCGRCGIAGAPLEAQIVADMFAVIEAKVTTTPAPAEPTDHDLAALDARLSDLGEMFAAGEIDRAGFVQAREAIERRIADAQQAVAADARTSAVSKLASRPGGIREAWPDLSLDVRRSVVAEVIDRIVIASTTKANNRFDPGRIAVDWKI